MSACSARRSIGSSWISTCMRRAALLRAVADRLDVVPVGIEDEGAVVARVVLGARARCAVVSPACRQRQAVENADAGPVLAAECDVEPRGGRALLDPEAQLASACEAGAGDRM